MVLTSAPVALPAVVGGDLLEGEEEEDGAVGGVLDRRDLDEEPRRRRCKNAKLSFSSRDRAWRAMKTVSVSKRSIAQGALFPAFSIKIIQSSSALSLYARSKDRLRFTWC